MAKIKTVNDPSDKDSPPSVAEMRASQQRGGEGNGTQDSNYDSQEHWFGQCSSNCPIEDDDSQPDSNDSGLGLGF